MDFSDLRPALLSHLQEQSGGLGLREPVGGDLVRVQVQGDLVRVQVRGHLVWVAVHGELMEGGLQDGRPAQDTRARPYYALVEEVSPGEGGGGVEDAADLLVVRGPPHTAVNMGGSNCWTRRNEQRGVLWSFFGSRLHFFFFFFFFSHSSLDQVNGVHPSMEWGGLDHCMLERAGKVDYNQPKDDIPAHAITE